MRIKKNCGIRAGFAGGNNMAVVSQKFLSNKKTGVYEKRSTGLYYENVENNILNEPRFFALLLSANGNFFFGVGLGIFFNLAHTF